MNKFHLKLSVDDLSLSLMTIEMFRDDLDGPEPAAAESWRKPQSLGN